MKSEIIKSAACFCVLMVCGLAWVRALAAEDARWALFFVWMGFGAALKMCLHVAAAVDAARGPRRPRRRTADEWQRVIERVSTKRKGGRK